MKTLFYQKKLQKMQTYSMMSSMVSTPLKYFYPNSKPPPPNELAYNAKLVLIISDSRLVCAFTRLPIKCQKDVQVKIFLKNCKSVQNQAHICYQRTIDGYNNLLIPKEKCNLTKVNNKNLSCMLWMVAFTFQLPQLYLSAHVAEVAIKPYKNKWYWWVTIT